MSQAGDLFRLYALDEIGADGYPPAWHEAIKHIVRTAAHHRCVRCKHPYRVGEHGTGEWSPCDEWCLHHGAIRVSDEARISDAPIGLLLNSGMIEKAEAHWRILTVHHLDGDKANCRWWNLVALCQRCHLEIQGKVRMSRRWPHEHSDWFKPYVAGYYALAFLGEDLSRTEVEARLDELLALEDRQLSLQAALSGEALPAARETES